MHVCIYTYIYIYIYIHITYNPASFCCVQNLNHMRLGLCARLTLYSLCILSLSRCNSRSCTWISAIIFRPLGLSSKRTLSATSRYPSSTYVRFRWTSPNVSRAILCSLDTMSKNCKAGSWRRLVWYERPISQYLPFVASGRTSNAHVHDKKKKSSTKWNSYYTTILYAYIVLYVWRDVYVIG